MPKLGGPAIDARSDQGKRGAEFGVPIALNDLRGQHRRFKSELFTNLPFNFGIEMRMRSDRAAQFPHANTFGSLRQPFECASKLVEHQRKFQTKSDRFRMNAVTAADHGCELVPPRLFRDYVAKLL